MATPRGAKLIVGLDYGTTKTCIAYAYWDPRHPQASTIKCVPFGKKQFVPSHVGYGGNGEVLWGNAASGSAVPGYTWTKVLLNDDGPQEHSFGSGLLSRLVRNGFFYMSKDKPDTVVVDFLKQVRKHVAAHLELDYMEEVPPTEFWFTIPATWTEKARDRFLRAINLAGFGTRPQDHVLFLLEAEAAALAVPDQLPPLQTGKSRAIVVCDCGGATSDITAFRISNNGSDLEFSLMSASTGVYCGGAEVDARLLKHLEVTDPDAMAAATEQEADLVATVEMAVRLKMDFTGNEPRRAILPTRRVIKLDAAVMREIIDPVIEGIVGLVLDNITERVENEESRIIETVCLIGGFSQLPYLRDRLTDALKNLSTVTRDPKHSGPSRSSFANNGFVKS